MTSADGQGVVLYALVCIDPSTTIEDVVVGQMGGIAIPMVGPNPEMLIEAGANMARGTGIPMRLVKFTQDEEIQVFSPAVEVPDDASGVEDGECSKCGGVGCEACSAEFLQNPPDEDMQYPRTQY